MADDAARVGRERVVRAGLKLLAEVGLDGLTLRGIAGELGVQAPTLYWRFKNKQDLIDEMATQVMADWANGFAATRDWPATWRDAATAMGTGLRTNLLRYRDGARMVAGSRLTDTRLYGPMEKMLATFGAAGIEPADAQACMTTIYSYTIGFLIEEQAVVSPDGTRNPQYPPGARAARMDPEVFPLGRSLGDEMFTDHDRRFARGLAMIVAGFDAERL